MPLLANRLVLTDDDRNLVSYEGPDFVLVTRTINGKPLSADIVLDAADVGADAAGSAAAVQVNLTTLAESLGSAAFEDAGAFATAAALDGYQLKDSDLTAIAALSTTAYGRAFLELADAAAARAAAGVTATGSDTTYAYRANNLSDLGSASTARTNLGLGTIATRAAPSGTVVGDTDTQTLTNKTLGSPLVTGTLRVNGAPATRKANIQGDNASTVAERIFAIYDSSGTEMGAFGQAGTTPASAALFGPTGSAVVLWQSGRFLLNTAIEWNGIAGSIKPSVSVDPGLIVQSQNVNHRPFVIRGASGQNLNLFECQTSTGTTLMSVDKDGNSSAPTVTATTASKTNVKTVGTLPSAADGLRSTVSDSTVAAAGNFGAAVAGGGANKVPVWATNAGWFIG